jgi:hypothetical protein
MDNEAGPPIDLNVRRFEKHTDPKAHSPVTALDVAMQKATELKPDHVIVVFGKNMDDDSGTLFFQAGKFTNHAQMGMLWEAMHLMRESCNE